jgi:hypothetical protein
MPPFNFCEYFKYLTLNSPDKLTRNTRFDYFNFKIILSAIIGTNPKGVKIFEYIR